MAIHDALEPDRIVVGVESARGLDVLRRLYAPLLEAGAPLIVTDIRTAELAKHASNAFLALKISFANALARVCEHAGADVTTVADIMGADPVSGVPSSTRVSGTAATASRKTSPLSNTSRSASGTPSPC